MSSSAQPTLAVRRRGLTSLWGRVRVALRQVPAAGLHACALFRGSLQAALEHDFLTLAQAVAYSGIVSIFPAMIVAAAVAGYAPWLPLRAQLATFGARVLPADVTPLLRAYFAPTPGTHQTTRALLSAFVVSLVGAGNVMSTLMESFRRAYDLPMSAAGFLQRRLRALLLVPMSLVPLALTSALVVFGRVVTEWVIRYASPGMHAPLLTFALVLRWTVALSGSVAVIAQIYHLGTDVTHGVREYVSPMLHGRLQVSWRRSLPGAAIATGLWFASTLSFGWYVTRYANYGRVYGSLGAAIALLVWLYLIALSVVWGAEFNAQQARMAAVAVCPLQPRGTGLAHEPAGVAGRMSDGGQRALP